MADPLKQITSVAFAKAEAKRSDNAARAMAEHCDARINKVTKAIDREEKYLQKMLRSKTTGGIMAGDVEGAFHRLRTALDWKVS